MRFLLKFKLVLFIINFINISAFCQNEFIEKIYGFRNNSELINNSIIPISYLSDTSNLAYEYVKHGNKLQKLPFSERCKILYNIDSNLNFKIVSNDTVSLNENDKYFWYQNNVYENYKSLSFSNFKGVDFQSNFFRINTIEHLNDNFSIIYQNEKPVLIKFNLSCTFINYTYSFYVQWNDYINFLIKNCPAINVRFNPLFYCLNNNYLFEKKCSLNFTNPVELTINNNELIGVKFFDKIKYNSIYLNHIDSLESTIDLKYKSVLDTIKPFLNSKSIYSSYSDIWKDHFDLFYIDSVKQIKKLALPKVKKLLASERNLFKSYEGVMNEEIPFSNHVNKELIDGKKTLIDLIFEYIKNDKLKLYGTNNRIFIKNISIDSNVHTISYKEFIDKILSSIYSPLVPHFVNLDDLESIKKDSIYYLRGFYTQKFIAIKDTVFENTFNENVKFSSLFKIENNTDLNLKNFFSSFLIQRKFKVSLEDNTVTFDTIDNIELVISDKISLKGINESLGFIKISELKELLLNDLKAVTSKNINYYNLLIENKLIRFYSYVFSN